MRRWLPALALVALLTGCASAGPSPSAGTPPAEPPDPSPAASAEPAPRFIGPSDDGATFTLTVGSTTTLRTTDAEASDPEVDGTSVLVIPVVNVASSSGREWEVRAVEPGLSTLSGAAGETAWTITVSVSE